jgi:WD40 repeat protein
VAGGGEDGSVLLWSVADSDAEPKTLLHETMIRTVTFSPGGSLLAAGDASGGIHLWDVESGRLRVSLDDHEDAVTSLSFAADSKTLFSSSFEGTINSWSAKQPPYPALATIKVEAGKVWATAVSQETSRVAVGGRGGFVRILDLVTGKQVGELEDEHPATVDCLEFSHDGSLLATGGWRSDEVVVWRADDGTRQQSFKADGNIRAIAFSPDGKQIAAGCEDKLLVVWDVETGDVAKNVGAHSQPVYDVSFSPDGNTIATCCGDWTEAKPGRVKLWKTSSLTEIARLDGHELAVRSAVFDPDGKRLASVSEDGVIRIWDVETQTELAALRNSAGARPLEWSPDGKLLAAGLHDGTTNIWNLKSSSVVRRFGGNEDTFSVRFVPDGSVLVGAGGEKQITLWDTSDLVGDAGDNRTVGAVRNWVKKDMP